MSIFGTIISDDQVEDAVVAILQKWLPTYMSEVERQRGLVAGFYERPPASSYFVRSDFDKFPEDMLPALVITSGGIEDDPPREGRGQYRGGFQIGVSCVCASTDSLYARRFAYRMGAAVRALLIQHQSLDGALNGRLRGIDWVGGRNNELKSEDDRSIWAARQLFTVEVGDVLTRGGGPVAPDSTPLPDPTTPWPDPKTIDSVKVGLGHSTP